MSNTIRASHPAGGRSSTLPNRLPRRIALFLLLCQALLAPTSVWAAYITTNEAGMDAVFSQASFATPIDIRFETPVYINDPTYLDIDTSAKLSGLWGLAPFGIPTVNMFFVDTIDYCGGYNTGIVGCGSFPGNIFAVESSFADSTWGTELAAHELAHNLGLGHVTGSNLMNPSLNGNTDLTGSQVATIFASPLVQHDGSGYFISITPIAITAVPLPGAVLLFGSGIIGLAFIRRRQTQTA